MTSPSARLGRIGRVALVAVPLAFLGVFFVYPVATIAGRGLWPGGRLDLDPVAEVLTNGGLRDVLWFTLWQAALSTLLTMLVALPAAYVVARFRFPGRTLVRSLVVVPFVLPTVVVATAFLALGVTPSLGAILLAHVFFNYAVVVRVVGGLWSHLDPREEDAARVLGASRPRALFAVTLPALRPALLAAAAIVFLFCFTSFGVILLLGSPGQSTLETEIYRQTTQLLDLRTAAALSVVQLVAVICVLTVTGRAEGRRSVALRLASARETLRRARGAGERLFVTLNLLVMATLLGTPVAVLVGRSFSTANGPGLAHYRDLGELHASSVLFVPPTEAVRNSVLYASAATLIAVTVGAMAAFAVVRTRVGRAVGGALALPLGVSAVTVGFGFLIALDEPPLDLRTSWILVPIAHALVAIPFVVRIITPVLRSIDPRLHEAAAVLGASPRRAWREIDVPIVARSSLIAAGLAFAISLGEFGATAFLARPDAPTLPVVIFRLLGQPGNRNFGAAMAASTVLMALVAVAVLLIDRVRGREAVGF